MAHAEICPVCSGKGKGCHGCKGEGWVSVDDGHIRIDVAPLPIQVPAANPYPDWGNTWKDQ